MPGATAAAPGTEGTAQPFQELLSTVMVLGDGQGQGLELVLESVIHSGCRLVRARSGILGLFGHDHVLRKFIAAGIEQDTAGDNAAPFWSGRPDQEISDRMTFDAKDLRLRDPRGLSGNPAEPGQLAPAVSVLDVPVTAHDDLLGRVFWIDKIDGEDFTADDEQAAIALASAVGIAIKDSRRDEENLRRRAWLEACRDVSAHFGRNDLRGRVDGLDFIAARACRASDAGQALVLVPGKEEGTFFVAGAAGQDRADAVGRVVQLDQFLKLQAAPPNQAFLADGAGQIGHLPGPNTGDPLIITLHEGDYSHGLLLIRGAKDHGFTPTDLEMGSHFASHVALSMQLHEVPATPTEDPTDSGQEHITRDLLDDVMERLFAAGLGVRNLTGISDHEEVLRRAKTITAELDDCIRHLRETTTAQHPAWPQP